MKEKDQRAIKAHWFLVAFSAPGAGTYIPLSLFMSLPSKNVTKPALDQARADRQIPPNAVVQSVSYLGHMTQYQFTGTSADPVPSVVSQIYLDALTEAVKAPDPTVLDCPYGVDDAYSESEWIKGHVAGKLLRTSNPELAMTVQQPSAPAEKEHY